MNTVRIPGVLKLFQDRGVGGPIRPTYPPILKKRRRAKLGKIQGGGELQRCSQDLTKMGWGGGGGSWVAILKKKLGDKNIHFLELLYPKRVKKTYI